MRILLLCFALLCISYATEYARGEIDTHGGKESTSYQTKSDFKNATFGVSMFLDKNITEKREPTKK